jgi:hypothetical protein
VPSQHVSDSTTSTTLSATSTSADAEAGVGSTGGVAARLGAQGEMFMHMHRRLLRSDAYKKYKAGLHHTQQQRGKNGEPVTQEDAPAAVMPAESDINGVLRTPAALSAADLASFRRDVTAPATAAAHGGERPMPAAALGVRKHGALLSEESEFKYNPCTQAYTVGEWAVLYCAWSVSLFLWLWLCLWVCLCLCLYICVRGVCPCEIAMFWACNIC